MASILELFPEKLINKLSDICDNIDIPDNNFRADKMIKALKKYGFEEVGCGTNRIVVREIDNEEFVYKIALDGMGINDNNMEYDLSFELPGLVVKNYETTGLISKAQFVYTFNSEDIDTYYNDVMDKLNIIKQKYLLFDVGPRSYKNWGYTTDAYGNVEDILLLDYAYLVKMSDISIKRCRKCGCSLSYKDDLSGLICNDCGTEYSFAQAIGSRMVSSTAALFGLNDEEEKPLNEIDIDDETTLNTEGI